MRIPPQLTVIEISAGQSKKVSNKYCPTELDQTSKAPSQQFDITVISHKPHGELTVSSE